MPDAGTGGGTGEDRGRGWTVAGRDLLLAGAVGVLAGLLVVALLLTVRGLTDQLLGPLAAGRLARARGEPGGSLAPLAFGRAAVLVLLVGLGSAGSAWLLRLLVRPRLDTGLDAALAALHHGPAGLRVRAGLGQLAATALAVGCGGSAGLAGPGVYAAGSLAAALARRTRLPVATARALLVAATAAAFAATFAAPVAGVVLAAEIASGRLRAERRATVMSVPAVLVAYAVRSALVGLLGGAAPPLLGTGFGVAPGAVVATCVVAVPLGLVGGLLGRLYVRTGDLTSRLLRRIPTNVPVSAPVGAGIAGAVVGAVGVVVPGVLGAGTGEIQQLGAAAYVQSLPLGVLLALPVLKLAASAFTTHSGSAGGVFGPALVGGAALGAVAWRLLALAGLAGGSGPDALVLVGAAAVLGAVARVPVGATLLAVELGGGVGVAPAALLAVVAATWTVGRVQLLPSQRRSGAPPSGPSGPG